MEVLFVTDNVYRFVQAGSEIPGLLGRMPAAAGYQPARHCHLLDAKIGKLFGVGFIVSNQVMAGRAIIGYGFLFSCVVTAIVTTEASRIGIVAEVVRVRAPCDFHEGKDIFTVDRDQGLRSLIDLRTLPAPDSRILRAIKGLQAGGNFGSGLFLGCVAGLDQGKPLFMHERQRHARPAFRHIVVQCIFGCSKGMSWAIVAVDAIHETFSAGNRSLHVRKFGGRTVGIRFTNPMNGLVLRIGSNVLDMAQMRAMDAAQVAELIPAANV